MERVPALMMRFQTTVERVVAVGGGKERVGAKIQLDER